jgi:hypothetical protein
MPLAVNGGIHDTYNVAPSMPYPKAAAEVTNFAGERMPADTLAQEVVPEIYLNDVTLAPAMPYPRASAEVTKFTDAGLFDRHSKELLAPSLPYNKRAPVDTANWFAYQK